ncbi:MAG: UPF0280 family protein, partial [Deltaproteobacteria bacterium]|nr:UPF0280 family protein [Deltaproteobacteria bacterium]
MIRRFSYKGANFRICSDGYDAIVSEIIRQRRILSDYIQRLPEFLTSLTPLAPLADAPDIAIRMHKAADNTGVGPMAAVAGTTAQMAAEAALKAGASKAVVENGGDIFLASGKEVVIGLYAGKSPLSGKLGFCVAANEMPVSVCSSSSRMGHSLSLGDCDLACVVSKDAALADASATLAANLVTRPADIDAALEHISQIKGITGVLIVKDDRVGMAGSLPRLVRHNDP